MFNFFLCWSCCEEEGREEVSRDVTDSRSDTFSRSSNGCSVGKQSPFPLLILASYLTKRITCTKISSIDCKQSETVDDCVSISLLPRFCIATRCQQDVTIEIFLSLASCLRSSAIIGDWSGMNVKGVSIYANWF